MSGILEELNGYGCVSVWKQGVSDEALQKDCETMIWEVLKGPRSYGPSAVLS